MNHKRLEAGVDLKALVNTSPKRLLRGFFAGPDSPDAVSIGYMIYDSVALTTLNQQKAGHS
jgi:hypothetical protein